MSDLIKNNPFRTLGVYANATSSAIAGRSMQLQAKLRSGLPTESRESLCTLCGNVGLTPESISAARSALQRPADRLEHALFWFTAADAIDTAAIDAIGKGNFRHAEDIWKGSPESVSARHNLAVLQLATGRPAEAMTTVSGLFADKARELCSLLAPGISMSPAELHTLYTRLAPAATPAVREASSEVIEPRPVRPKPKPRPAVSIKKEPESMSETMPPTERPTVPPAYPGRMDDVKKETAMPPKITESATENAPRTDIKDTLEYLNGCIRRLTAANPSIEECTRFFDDADSGMSRLRNILEHKDRVAYRSWADGCARHLMAALSRLGTYHKGEFKTARAMTLLSKCKSWSLSPEVEKEVNDYIARLYAAKSNNYANTAVIIAIVLYIILILIS